MFSQFVSQADEGCDFKFLETGAKAAATGEPEIH